MVFLVTFKRFPFACGNAGERYALTSRCFYLMERTSLPAPCIVRTLRPSGRCAEILSVTSAVPGGLATCGNDPGRSGAGNPGGCGVGSPFSTARGANGGP